MSLKVFCRTHKKEVFIFYIHKVMHFLSVTLTEVTKGSKGSRLGFCPFCHCHAERGHVFRCVAEGTPHPQPSRVIRTPFFLQSQCISKGVVW